MAAAAAAAHLHVWCCPVVQDRLVVLHLILQVIHTKGLTAMEQLIQDTANTPHIHSSAGGRSALCGILQPTLTFIWVHHQDLRGTGHRGKSWEERVAWRPRVTGAD